MTQPLDKRPITRHFVDMKAAVADALRMGFRDYRRQGVMDYDIKVLRADPPTMASLPAVAISRTSDVEVNKSLGDMFAYERDKDTDSHFRRMGTDFKESLEIRIWTTNSDQRDQLYAITKAILFEWRTYLALQYGLVNQAITGGRDAADHVKYRDHLMYWGVINFTAENSIQMNLRIPTLSKVESRLTQLFSVADVKGEMHVVNAIDTDKI